MSLRRQGAGIQKCGVTVRYLSIPFALSLSKGEFIMSLPPSRGKVRACPELAEGMGVMTLITREWLNGYYET